MNNKKSAMTAPSVGPTSTTTAALAPLTKREKTTSMERELEALGRFRTGKIIGDKWKIICKLDEGGFGQVYKVQNVKASGQFAALKVEPSNTAEGDHLKLETAVLKDIHSRGFKDHIPLLFRSAKRKTYCYMIIMLLGKNLRYLKRRQFDKGMPLRTWCRIGIQCLYGIKTMHDSGYVHRDIKATNFVLGHPSVPAQARMVYVIDFGLARAYAFGPPPGGPRKTWIARRARANVDFRGTWKYASCNMHENMEQGRRDDTWSLLYMMIDLYCGLPWGDGDSNDMVLKKKMNISDEALMTRMPPETTAIPRHLRTLDVYSRPDYHLLYKSFDDIRKRVKVSFTDRYEWETAEESKRNMEVMASYKGYTEAEKFMKEDPVGVSRAPTVAEEDEIKSTLRKKKIKPECLALEDVIGAIERRDESKDEKTTMTVTKDEPSIEKRGEKEKEKKVKKDNPHVASTKRISSEDSDDFVPSCYMNLAIPKTYLVKTHDASKDVQKRVAAMEWGNMSKDDKGGSKGEDPRRK